MAPNNDLAALLSKLKSSVDSADINLSDTSLLLPPADGISLLDVKTELFLSYLQNLTFLILLKIRGQDNKSLDYKTANTITSEAVVKNLIELRIYLEKGIQPLEGRLKYQIDKVLRAADTAAVQPAKALPKKTVDSDDDGSDSDSQHSSSSAEIDELSYRPNPSAFTRPTTQTNGTDPAAPSDGLYRPPRITPTSLPTTAQAQFRETGGRSRAERPQRSRTLDEFVEGELSNAPAAEPSVGSTIIAGGRRVKSTRERAGEDERRVYEESNFVRLPAESKKEKRAKIGRDGGRELSAFGGEEMRGLGEGADRISSLTARKGAKRVGRETVDGPRGQGFGDEVRARKKRRN